MGLAELAVLLFFVLTLGHYIVSWAVYLEKAFELVSISLVFRMTPMTDLDGLYFRFYLCFCYVRDGGGQASLSGECCYLEYGGPGNTI